MFYCFMFHTVYVIGESKFIIILSGVLNGQTRQCGNDGVIRCAVITV